ncbi:MAG: ABC transporter ATP-binding protein [Leptolyngbya sp. SIO3F4]|nr:ABC transporter ATP-binding protein [Leptolyngbya sp. SIO3F4]
MAYSNQQSKLTANSVSKHYRFKRKNVLAISNVSFQVNEGDICVLLGPSGCGKSTLLRMIAGLLPVSSGEITLSGKPISGPGKDRGMIFQSYTSFPWLTVQENVEYGLRVNGYAKRERQKIACHFIEQVNLTKFRDAYPEQLSGGMRQRVAIARTLANGPDILLMDEPFGALDAETRWQMQELLLDIVHHEKVTALIVTHDVEEALFLADNIVFLSKHPGTVKECIATPLINGSRPSNKADMFDSPQYINLEKKIIHMMREEAYGTAL